MPCDWARRVGFVLKSLSRSCSHVKVGCCARTPAQKVATNHAKTRTLPNRNTFPDLLIALSLIWPPAQARQKRGPQSGSIITCPPPPPRRPAPAVVAPVPRCRVTQLRAASLDQRLNTPLEPPAFRRRWLE